MHSETFSFIMSHLAMSLETGEVGGCTKKGAISMAMSGLAHEIPLVGARWAI